MALFNSNEKLPKPTFKTVGDVWQITLTEDSVEVQQKQYQADGKGPFLYWPPAGGRPIPLAQIPDAERPMARPLMQAVVRGITADGTEMRHYLADEQLKAAQQAYRDARAKHPTRTFKPCFERGGVFAMRFSEEVPGKGPIPKKKFESIYQPPLEDTTE